MISTPLTNLSSDVMSYISHQVCEHLVVFITVAKCEHLTTILYFIYQQNWSRVPS